MAEFIELCRWPVAWPLCLRRMPRAASNGTAPELGLRRQAGDQQQVGERRASVHLERLDPKTQSFLPVLAVVFRWRKRPVGTSWRLDEACIKVGGEWKYHRCNAFVEAMNGLMQQAKRAARGFRTAANFIAIAYLRLGKLTHLPASPIVQAMPLAAGQTMRAA